MAVDSKKIAEQISDAVKKSPAYTQRPEVKKIVDAIKTNPDEGALTAALRKESTKQEEPVGAMTEALRRGTQEQEPQTQEVPLIELGEIYDIPSSLKRAFDEEKHSGPIDKSKGIDFGEDGMATQKIATDRVLGTSGAGEYAQSIYDNLDGNLGAASSGANEDDVYVRNLRAGNAGLNIATDSELNPIDGSNGNPAMFGRRYPKLNTTVEPFKVRIPNYNLEVMSQTIDPEKLAYQVATSIAGKPVSPYVGYTNVGFDITEPWYSTLTKGIGRAPIAVGSMAVKAVGVLPFLAAALEPVFEAGVNTVTGVDKKTTRDILMRELQSIADDYDSLANPWNDAIDSTISYLGLKNTSKTTPFTTAVGELPTVFAQVGLLYGISTLAAGTGLTLKAQNALTSVLGGALFGLSQGAEEFEELGRKGVNPIVRFRNTAVGTAGSIALNSLGLFAIFGSKLAAGRQFMQEYGKRMTAAAAQGILLGAAGEGGTEWADQVLQDYVTYNMGDDQAMNRLSNRAIAFALGAASGAVFGGTAQVRNERIQIAREEIKKAHIRANAPQWLKELDTAVREIAGEGVYTKEQALELIIGMASPEGQKIIKQKQNDTLMGLLDKMNPEAVKYVQEIGARESAKIIERLNKLDQQAFNAIPETVDMQTRTMVARAIKAIAPLIEVRGGKFRMPSFVARPGEPMQWDPKTNTLYINTESTGEAIDIMEVQNKGLKTLDPVQRGILHELGHMMDSMLGQGTNYKEFLPVYFEAIAKVFGKEKAEAVRAKMPNEADRLAYAKSQKKADKNEKAMDRLTGQINEKNTSEYFAYALGRLGRRIGKAFGFSGADSAQYIDAANVLAMTLHIPQITKQLTAYQNAMNTLIKNNDETLAEMAKAAGDEGLARKIQDYAAGNVDALTPEEVLSIYNILKSYVGVDGMKILDDAFKGVKPETFMERAEREFGESIRETGHTVGQVQEALKKKGETNTVVQDNVSPQGLYEFVGMHAQLPIIQQLNQAQQMMEQKVDAQDIFKQTGWFFDSKDKKWKYDIGIGNVKYEPASVQYINNKPRSESMFLDYAYDNPELYDAYPILKDTMVTFTPSDEKETGGKTTYSSKTNSFSINIKYNPNDIEKSLNSVLVHEIQHAIQDIENFARGGSTTEFMNMGRIQQAYDTKGVEVGQKVLKEEIDKAWPKYQALAGEIESRNVQNRYLNRNLLPGLGNPEGVLPKYTQDIPDTKAIVKFDNLEIPVAEPTQKYIWSPTDINEDVFDVSQILGDQKKQRESALEKRANEKPTGNNYATDAEKVTQIIKEAKPAPKWFTKMFGNGDINTALWAIGGQKLVDHFDLIGKMNRSDDEATGLMEEFDNRIKKELGFKNNIDRDAFMNQASVESIPVDYMIDPLTGDVISSKISPLVAMNVYLHAKNPKTHDNMLNAFGGNGKQMQDVIDALTPEQKKYADVMQEFIKDKWTQYKKSFEQEGDTIEDEPYWPIVEAIHAATGERKVNSNIARKEGKNYAISLDVDAREIFNTYVQRVAGADNHVYSTIRRIKDLMGYEKNEYSDDYPTQAREKLSNDMWNNSRRIRGLALRNMGDESRYNRFLDLLNDFLAKREQSPVGSQALNIAARNLTGGLLQWKPLQFMKNLANVSGFWGLADNQAQYWQDTAWAATHPIEAAKYMMDKVPFIRNRYKGQNIDEMLTQQTAGTDSLLMNWAKRSDKLGPQGQKVVSNLVALTQASRRAGYTPMLSGDLASNVIGGYGLLKQYEAKYGDKAGDKLSEAIVRHQASSNQATRSLLQREWSRDIRGELARFSSEGIQKIKSMATAVAQAQQGERTAGNAAKEILSTLSSMILFALISAGVIDLFDNDEENDKEVYEALGQEGLSAILGGSIIGNSIISPIVSTLFGGRGDIGTPMSKILTQDFRKLSKGDWDDAVIDGISATVPIVGLKNLVGETRGGYRTATGATPEERWSGLRQLFGRSENFADERAGIKKVEKNEGK